MKANLDGGTAAGQMLLVALCFGDVWETTDGGD